MRKILITGSNGLLGQKLVYKLCNNPSYKLIATAQENGLVKTDGYIYESMDITNKARGNSASKYLPDVIINTTAMTNVDACETDREGAWQSMPNFCEYQVKALEGLMAKDPIPNPTTLPA